MLDWSCLMLCRAPNCNTTANHHIDVLCQLLQKMCVIILILMWIVFGVEDKPMPQVVPPRPCLSVGIPPGEADPWAPNQVEAPTLQNPLGTWKSAPWPAPGLSLASPTQRDVLERPYTVGGGGVTPPGPPPSLSNVGS